MSEVSFTCNTCGLSFQQADFQREHMKTDWHRYNLKRRVASLPPVPSEVFAEKMIQQRSSQLGADSKDHSRRQVTKKDLKRMEKMKKREDAHQSDSNGLNKNDQNQDQDEDQTHKSRSRASSITSGVSNLSLGKPSGGSTYQSDAEDSEEDGAIDVADVDQEALIQEKIANMVTIPTNISFMDGHVSGDVLENTEYLEKKYGLVIPEQKYLQDVNGLVGYLNEKVGLGNCCLYCPYMGRSLEAVRAHMSSKSHVKIPYDTYDQKMELADFYDFTASYANDGDDGWEAVSDEDVDETDETVVLGENDDENVLDGGVYDDGYQLHLAPGVKAGHRSLQRYFKQRLSSPIAEKPGRMAVKMIDFRGPGVTEKQANVIVKERWKEQRKKMHSDFKHDRHVNFQKHFRDELLQ